MIGAGGVSGIQNTDAVNLEVNVSNGSFSLTTGSVFHSAEIRAGTIILSADIATDTGGVELNSTSGDIDLSGRNITSAGNINVRVQSFGSGGRILNATGNISAGPARDINFTADGNLTVGAGGVSGIQNANVSFLTFRSNSGAVTFASGSNLSALSIEAQAATGISVQSDLTALLADIDLTTSAGDIDLGNRTILAGADLNLEAAGGSIKNASGAIRSDIGFIKIETGTDLTIGAGGISNIQGLNTTDLDISSNGGNVNIVGGLEVASLEIDGQREFNLTGGNLSTTVGDLDINIAGAVNLNGNKISSGGDLLLTAGDVTNPGNFDVAPNASLNLTLPTASEVNFGSGGVNTIENTEDVNFILNLTSGSVTFSSAQTWNTLAVNARNITLAGALTTDGGNLSLAATSGDIDLGNQALTADDDISLVVTNGSVTNAGGTIVVGKQAKLSITQSADLTIGTGGVSNIQNPQDVNLFAFSSGGNLTFAGTTYHSLIGAAQRDVNVAQSLTTDSGLLALSSLAGDINLNSNSLAAATNLSLEAQAGALNNFGNLQTGADAILSLKSLGDLTIPVGNITNTNTTTLFAEANGDLTISTAAIWNGLFLQGRSLNIGASQATDANISLAAPVLFSGDNVSTTFMQLVATSSDINLAGNNLTSATGLELEATNGGITGQVGAELSVGNGQLLSVEVDTDLIIGSGGLDSIQNSSNITLEIGADGDLTFASVAAWHTLTANADGNLVVNANQTTNTGSLSLKAGGRLLDNNVVLTSAADMTLEATNGGIQSVAASLSVGTNRTLTAVQADNLGLDLNADVLNSAQTNFRLTVNNGSLTFEGTSPLTVNSLTAFANGDVVLSSNISTNSGNLLLEAGNGNLKFSNNDLSANADMILQAFGGQLLNAGGLAVGSGRNLTLNSDAPLIIGSGGIVSIQNGSNVKLSAGSFSGTLLINGNNTWSALELKTQFDDVGGTGNPNNSDADVILNGDQTTSSGGDINIESAASIEFAGNNITSGGNMSLETNGNAEIFNAGNITVGAGETLLLRSREILLTDGGGLLTRIQNKSTVDLAAQATVGEAVIFSAASWRSLTLTGATGVFVGGNQATTGDITLKATTGFLDFGDNDLTSAAGNISLSAIAPAVNGGNGDGGAQVILCGEIVGTGTLSVGSGRLLSIAQDEELIIGTGGFDIANTDQVNLSVTSAFGEIIFTSPTTWHTLGAITTGNNTNNTGGNNTNGNQPEGEGIAVMAPQTTANGGISLSATGDIFLLGQALDSNTDITLSVSPDLNGEIIDAVGNISLGINGTLTITAREVAIGEGGISRIQNSAAVNLDLTSTRDDLSFINSPTFNSILARAGDGNQDDIFIPVVGLLQTDDGNISLISDSEIILLGTDLVAAGDLTVKANDGTIRGANVFAAGSGKTMTLSQSTSISIPTSVINNADQTNLVVSSTGGDVVIENAATFNSLSVTAERNVRLGGNLTTDTGNLALVGNSGKIDAANHDLSSAGNLTLNATGPGGQIVAGDLSGSSVAVSADSKIILTTVIDGGGGNVILTAPELLAQGDGLTIQSARDVDIHVENTVVSAGALTVGGNITGKISTADANGISVNGDLVFSTSGSAGITLGNATLTANNVTLVSGGTITDGTVGAIRTNGANGKLVISSVGSTTLDASGHDVDLLAAQVTGAGSAFEFHDIDGFTISSDGGIVGVSTNNGAITLKDVSTESATITIPDNLASDSVRSGGGLITIHADSVVINSGGAFKAINSSNGDVIFKPFDNDRSLELGTGSNLQFSQSEIDEINVGTGTLEFRGGSIDINAPISLGSTNVIFAPANASTTIGIGTGTGSFSLSAAELGNLSGTGTVTIGRTDGTGNITSNTLDLTAETYDFKLQTSTGVIGLNGTISTNSQDLTFAGPVQAFGSLIIDTESDTIGNGGNVTFTSTLDADSSSGGRDLTVDTSGGAPSGGGGSITFGAAVGAAQQFNDISLDARNGGAGLNGIILLSADMITNDNGNADLASITISGPLFLGGTVNLLTSDGNESGGFVDLQNAVISATTSGVDLTVGTSHSGSVAGKNGGDIQLGTFNNGGGQFVNDLTTQSGTNGTAGTTGTVTLHGDINIDEGGADRGDFTIESNAPIVITSSITIDTNKLSSIAGNIDFVESGSGGSLSANGTDFVLLLQPSGTGSSGDVELPTMNAAGGQNVRSVVIQGGRNVALTGATALAVELQLTSAESVTVDGPVSFIGGNGFVDLQADSIAINSTVDSGTGNINLLPTQSSRTIGIGDNATGDFNLTSTEMTNLASTGTVTIGKSNGTGAIDIEALVLSNEGFTLSLIGGDISIDGALNMGSRNLTVQRGSAGTIGVGATAGSMTISGAELQNITAGSLVIGGIVNSAIIVDGISGTNSNNISGLLQLNATAPGGTVTFQTGSSTFNELAVNASDGISVLENVTAQSGTLALNSDVDADGIGNFEVAVGVNINTTNNPLVIEANDVNLLGSIIAGDVTLRPSQTTTTIGIGGGSGTFNLDDTEMTAGLTSTGRVTIGRAADGIGAVDIDDVNLSLETFALDIVGGSISVRGLNAGSNDVTLVARATTITDGDGGIGTDVRAGTVILTAQTGIGTTGASGSIELDATTVSATSTTSGGIFLNMKGTGGVSVTAQAQTSGDIEILGDTEAVSLNDLDTFGSNITVTLTSQDIFANDVVSNGDITLTTTTSGNITLGAVTAAGNEIRVNSATTIVDAAGTVTAGSLKLDSASGVGASLAPITTDVTNLAARASSGGGVFISENDALTVTTVDGLTGIDTNGANGEIEVRASDLTISQTINSGSGNITLSPNTAASTIGIGGGTGSFNLDDTEMTTGLTSTGRVTIGRAADGIGAVDIDDVNLSLETFALDIVGGSISVRGLNAGSNNITLIARSTTITDGDGGTGTDVRGGTVILTAQTGIGTTGANGSIELDATAVTATNSNSGGIFLNMHGAGGVTVTAQALTVGNIEIIGFDAVTLADLDTFGSDISVTMTGANIIASNVVAGANGDILLTTITSGDITLGAVDAAGNAITVTSAGSVIDDTGIVNALTVKLDSVTGIGLQGTPITTVVQTLAARTTTSGGVFIAENDGLTIGNVDGLNGISANNGEIEVRASDLTISQTINSGSGNVTLTALNGSITDGEAGTNIDISAGALTLSATGSIGTAANRLEVDVNTLSAASSTSGDIVIGNAKFLTLLDASTTASNIDVAVNGGLNVTGEVNARSNGDVTLASTNGDVNLNANVKSTAASSGASGDGSGVISITSTGIIDGTGNISATAGSLKLSSNGAAGSVNSPLSTAVATIAAQASSNGAGIFVNEADGLTIGSVGGVSGVSTLNGDITIATADGALTVTNTDAPNDVFAGDANITLTAGTPNQSGIARELAVDTNAIVKVTGNAAGGITLIANNMNLSQDSASAGLIDAGSRTVSLRPFLVDTIVVIGGTSADANGNPDTLGLNSTELGNIIGNQQIGDPTSTANFVINGVLTATGNTFTLTTSGAVVDNNPGVDIIGTNIVLSAGGGIGNSDDPIETQSTFMDIKNTSGNGVFISNNGALTIIDQDGDGFGLQNPNGGGGLIKASSPLTISSNITFAGDMTFEASNSAINVTRDDLTIAADITSTNGGTITFLAGESVIQTGGIITSNGGTVVMQADREGDNGDGFRGAVGQSAGSVVTGGLKISAFSDSGLSSITNNADTLSASITGGAFGYTDLNDLGIGNVDGQLGISTSGGNVGIILAGVNATLTIDGGLGVDTIRTSNGNVGLEADDIAISPGAQQAINSGSGSLTIAPHTGGRAISLGVNQPGELSLTDTESDGITSNGLVTIGSTSTGQINLRGNFDPANITQLVLISDTSIDSTAAANTLSVTTLSLDADNSIGATISIRIDADTFAARSKVSGNINVNDIDGLTIGTAASGITGISTTNSDITLTTVATLLVQSEINARNNGNVSIMVTAGNLDLQGSLLSTAASTGSNGDGSGTITVDVQGGALNPGDGSVRAAAGNANLKAANGIGSSTGNTTLALSTTLSSLAAQATGSNAPIVISETDNLVIGNIDGTAGISTNGGEVVLQSLGTNAALTIPDDLSDDTIRTSNGVVDIRFDNIIINSGGIHFAINSGNGEVTLEAPSNSTVISVGGGTDQPGELSITQAELNEISVGSGPLFIEGKSDLTLKGNVTVIAGAFILAVEDANGGNISADNANNTITTSTLILAANGNIGLGNPIKFDSSNVIATSTGTGNISLIAVNNFSTGSAVIDGNVTISGVSASNGDIELQAGGNVNIGHDINAGGNGSVSLEAAGSVAIAANVRSTADTTSSNGDGSGTIAVKATSGNITHAAGFLSATAGSAAFQAVSGVGSSTNPLELSVNKVAASTTGSGAGIFLRQSNSLTIGNVDGFGQGISTANGDIEVTASDLSLTEAIQAGTGNVTLQPFNGNSTIGVGGGAGSFKLDATELTTNLNSSGTVIIGRAADGTGAVDIDDVNLSLEAFALNVVGGSISVRGLNAGSNNVTLVARSTNITDGDGGTNTDVTGGTIILTAQTGIGATGANGSIELDATTLTATNSNSGGIFLNMKGTGGVSVTAQAQTSGDIEILGDTEAVSLNDLDTFGSNITVTLTSQDIFANDVVSNGDITLTTTTSGNITLGAVTAAGNEIRVNSATTIVDAAGTVTSGSLKLDSTSGVGTSLAPITTDVTNLAARAASGGGVFISENDALTVTTVDGLTGIDTNGANGEIEVQASDLTISQTINSGSGNITLSPNTAASTIGIGGGTGSFNLDDTEMTTGLTSTGRVTIGRAADGIGAVDIDDVNLSLETFALDIVGGSISVTGLDAAANSVALVARAGEITDGEAGTATDVTSGGLSLRATGAIGSSANPIDTSTNTIAATSGDGIFLNETDAITIGSSGGVTGLTTTGNNGEVQLSAGGSITASNVVTADGTGNVTLVASGAGSSLTISANVDTAGGDVRLLSGTGNSALLTINSSVISNGGDITLRADTADISADVNAGNGEILISTATQDGTRIIDLGTEITTTLSLNDSEIDKLITNSLLTIGDTNTGDVQIWASVSPSNAANTTIISGAQIEGNSGSTLTVGGILTLDARDAIFGVSGTGGDKLALNAETLAARSRGDLNVSIVEADSVIFASSNGASSAFNGVEGGRVEVVASNSIGFNVGLATNGDLLLSAGGSIDGGSNDLNAQGAVTLTGTNITIGSVTSAAGINVTASGTLSMSSILDGGNQNVSVTADDLKATTDGLLVRNAAGVTFTVDSMNIGGGDFNVDSATGIVQFSGTTDIDVSGNHNFIASTSSSTGIILNTADILAGNIQFLATSGQVQMSGGQLAVSQDGGQVNIQQNTGLSINESGIVLGGDTSFIALNILSNDFIRFFAGQRLSNALHLNSLSAVGNSTGIFVDGLLLADSAISLNSGSGFIHAGVNPIIAGGSLAINATGSAGSDIQAGTLTGVGVNLLAGDGITLARTIDALGGSVNINTTTLTGRNGLEIRNSNGVSITAQVVLQSGVFTINGVNQIVNTGVKVTGSRSPLLTATSNQPGLLEAQTIQSLRVVDEVTRTMEANRILEDIQALTSLANSLESAPNSFDRLMKTNEWLREAQTVIDYTREMLRKAGKDTDIAGEIFISLYCSDLAESHPKAFKLLKGLAAPEDEEKAESKE